MHNVSVSGIKKCQVSKIDALDFVLDIVCFAGKAYLYGMLIIMQFKIMFCFLFSPCELVVYQLTNR